jgi:hypothetical protein
VNSQTRLRDGFRRQHSRNHRPEFRVPLPCFFPLCLAGTPQILSGNHKKGMKNGTASNRDFLPIRGCLFEISAALAAGVWDGTRSVTFPSDYRGRAPVELLFCSKDPRLPGFGCSVRGAAQIRSRIDGFESPTRTSSRLKKTWLPALRFCSARQIVASPAFSERASARARA